jgi:hypothetical protein
MTVPRLNRLHQLRNRLRLIALRLVVGIEFEEGHAASIASPGHQCKPVTMR